MSAFRIIGAAILLLLAPALAWAAGEGRRVALVIGNSAYVNAPALKNPANDASDMAAKLKAMNFEVLHREDLDKSGMERAVREFRDLSANADIALFFYAGHALQVNGQNYLAPVTTKLDKVADLPFETVTLDFVREQLAGEASTQIFFLDSCRNNPLTRSLFTGTRAAAPQGMAPIATPVPTGGLGTIRQSYVAFSTSPNEVALDGEGRNSPFTAALLRHIDKPVEFKEIVTEVRNDVLGATDGRQFPIDSNGLVRPVFLVPPAAAPPPADDRVGKAAELYALVRESASVPELTAFLAVYGDTPFGEPVRARLAMLTAATAPEAPPVAPPAAPPAALPTALPTTPGLNAAGRISLAPAVPPAAPTPAPAATVEAGPAADTPIETAALDETQTQTRPETAPAPAEPALAPTEADTVRAVQEQLARIGCEPGGADGAWGGNSARALERYAAERGLVPAPREPDATLLARLKAETGRVCAPQARPRPKAPAIAAPAAPADPPRRKATAPAPKATTQPTRKASRPSGQRTATTRPSAPARKPSASNCFTFNGKLVCD